MQIIPAFRRPLLVLLLVLVPFWAFPSAAVTPDEMLKDPVLETRAREISSELRCLVCQNQSIDDSDAPLAKDLRILVRERLQAGDTDKEVRAFLVERYGEYILLRPSFSSKNLLLWSFAPLILLMGVMSIFLFYTRRKMKAFEEEARNAAALSDEEEAQLDEILHDGKEDQT